MLARLRHEAKKMRETDAKLRELEHAYYEFLDLRNENIRRKKHVENLVAMIGSRDWTARAGHDEMHANLNHSQILEAEELKSQLPLWEAMREYLSYVPEARIGEMEEFFQGIGFAEGNRQAIESALKRHPETFKTRKQKREKYIALK